MGKSFKETKAAQQLTEPALQFISQPEEARKEQEPVPVEPGQTTLAQLQAKAPEGYKVNPLYIEKKSKRVQLVMQPSLFDRAKAEADKLGVSFNEYMHIVLEDALNR